MVFSLRISLKVAKVSLLWCVKRWTALRETRYVIKAWERQTKETNSSRGIDLQGQQPLQKHHSLRTSSCYETRGRHELGLFWQFKSISGQGGSAFTPETHDQFEKCDATARASGSRLHNVFKWNSKRCSGKTCRSRWKCLISSLW